MNTNQKLATLGVGDVIKSARTLEVTYADQYEVGFRDVQNGTLFAIEQDGFHGSWGFEVVAKAAPKPKVGDVINGAEAYDALPVGTVLALADPINVTETACRYFKLGSGWVTSTGRPYPTDCMAADRKIVYLP